MKKNTKEYKNKSVKELEKIIQSSREEIAKARLHIKINPAKDTNFLKKKKKQLAILLTITTEKKDLELLQVKK